MIGQMDGALMVLKSLSFSKRTKALSYIEDIVRERAGAHVLWPDLLLLMTADDIHTAVDKVLGLPPVDPLHVVEDGLEVAGPEE